MSPTNYITDEVKELIGRETDWVEACDPVEQGAIRRFRLPAWQESVLRKQQVLAGVNQLLSHAADTRRGELLEITIILLILWEILYALFRRG